MLTRAKYIKEFRIAVRFLSDKSSKDDGVSSINETASIKSNQKTMSEAKDKIQELLKSMIAEPKTSESEYRAKFTSAPIVPRRRKQKDEIDVKMEKIEENITKAAGDVAQVIGGDTKHTEAELLSKVLGKINQTSTNLSNLLVGMKVDRSKDKDEVMTPHTRGQQVKRYVEKLQYEKQKTRHAQRVTKPDTQPKQFKRNIPQPIRVNIFSGEPLGIFKAKEPNYGTDLDVWENLKTRELALSTAQPPVNYFQKMIVWTEQGKVWKFPINNEQGLEEEDQIHFSEHIFLDTHLEDWCPKKGPIRHFMELVCVGLSKNAFYTAQEKKDHIMWYKEYFESKKDVLTEVGAWDVKPEKEVSV